MLMWINKVINYVLLQIPWKNEKVNLNQNSKTILFFASFYSSTVFPVLNASSAANTIRKLLTASRIWSPKSISSWIAFNRYSCSNKHNPSWSGSLEVSKISSFFKNWPFSSVAAWCIFKPPVLVKQTIGAPVSFDVSLNSLLYNRFEAGVSYRYQESVSGLLGFRIIPDLRIGYAYDFGIGDFSTTSSGSHEIILLYDYLTYITF